jgi:hypothetical protein
LFDIEYWFDLRLIAIGPCFWFGLPHFLFYFRLQNFRKNFESVQLYVDESMLMREKASVNEFFQNKKKQQHQKTL